MVDMPQEKIELLCRFLQQGDGKLSQRAREKEFAALIEEEVAEAEAAYTQSFQRQP